VLTRQFITGNSFLAGLRMSHAGVLKSIAKPYLTFGQEFGERSLPDWIIGLVKNHIQKEGLHGQFTQFSDFLAYLFEEDRSVGKAQTITAGILKTH
jgi:hypothetical protein